MKIAFIGHGNVGGALAKNLARLGHEVTIGARDPGSSSVKELLAASPGLAVAAPAEAAARAEVIFLATPFAAAEAAVGAIAAQLDGKVLVDCTNPVGPGLTHGLRSEQSGTQKIQGLVPGARVVKAFSIYGYENFEDSSYPGVDVKPVMMICGEDAAAKQAVAGLAEQLGWQPLDVGGAAQALHLEHMTLLWVRMARMGGRSPHTVWAMLTR